MGFSLGMLLSLLLLLVVPRFNTNKMNNEKGQKNKKSGVEIEKRSSAICCSKRNFEKDKTRKREREICDTKQVTPLGQTRVLSLHLFSFFSFLSALLKINFVWVFLKKIWFPHMHKPILLKITKHSLFLANIAFFLIDEEPLFNKGVPFFLRKRGTPLNPRGLLRFLFLLFGEEGERDGGKLK